MDDNQSKQLNQAVTDMTEAYTATIELHTRVKTGEPRAVPARNKANTVVTRGLQAIKAIEKLRDDGALED